MGSLSLHSHEKGHLDDIMWGERSSVLRTGRRGPVVWKHGLMFSYDVVAEFETGGTPPVFS